MRRVVPPTMTTVWIARVDIRPAARSFWNPSWVAMATERPRNTTNSSRQRSAQMPAKPISSPIAARMKSVVTTGTEPG
jgi:hypothetical protein